MKAVLSQFCLPGILRRRAIEPTGQQGRDEGKSSKRGSMTSDSLTSLSQKGDTSSMTIQAGCCESPSQAVNKAMASAVCDGEGPIFIECIHRLRNEYKLLYERNGNRPCEVRFGSIHGKNAAWNEVNRLLLEAIGCYKDSAIRNIPRHYSGNEDTDKQIEADINYLVNVYIEMHPDRLVDFDLPEISHRVEILKRNTESSVGVQPSPQTNLKTGQPHLQSQFQGAPGRLELIIQKIATHRSRVKRENDMLLSSQA
jgi:hypothetical protein